MPPALRYDHSFFRGPHLLLLLSETTFSGHTAPAGHCGASKIAILVDVAAAMSDLLLQDFSSSTNGFSPALQEVVFCIKKRGRRRRWGFREKEWLQRNAGGIVGKLLYAAFW
ncbi:hypothetical protein FKP32DRAFT_1602876 [Trametes sanguinea]|nr:hypothetical protein FKP32DRAFT_1602876 [Trametes sanguinea]